MRYGLISVLMLMFVANLAEGQGQPKVKLTPFVEPTEVLGRTFKEWVREIHAKDPSRREEAMQMILQFGPDRAYEAVPEILKELTRHKPAAPVDLAVRVNGIMTVSTILRLQKNPDPALLKDALAVYKTCLKDSQAIMKVRAVKGLPALGPIAHEAVDDVITVARDPATWELRKEGLQTLTIIGFNDKGVPSPKLLPELRRALDDPSVQVRLTALDALGMVSHANLTKTEETANLAKLVSHLQSESDKIAVIWTHIAIMSATKDVNAKHVGPIAKALKDPDPKVRMQALIALGTVKAKAKALAEHAVREALDDPDPGIAMAAIGTLVQLHADESIPALQRIVDNKKATQVMRDAAEEAIDQLKLVSSKSKEK